jgi:site-specific recombinase XerD
MSLITICQGCHKRVKEPCCGPLKFYADYFPEGRNGHRRQARLPESIQDMESASLYEQALRAAALEARKPGSVVKNLTASTIEDLTPDYLEWVELHQSKTTHYDKENTFIYVNKIVGNVPICGFNDIHIGLYQKARKADKVSNRTVNKEIDYLRGLLKWARDEKGIEVRPIRVKKLPHSRQPPIVLSPSEVTRLLDASNLFYKAFFLCLYSMGLRLSEARNIKWSDIDFENRALRCIQKGGEWKLLPMPDALQASLEALKKESKSEYVFVAKGRKKPVSNVRQPILKACQRAGIEKHVHAHLLRHSFATHMMGAGVSARIVQRMLGHADITQTAWYSHVAMEHMREASDTLTSLRNSGKKNAGLGGSVSTGKKKKVKQIR